MGLIWNDEFTSCNIHELILGSYMRHYITTSMCKTFQYLTEIQVLSLGFNQLECIPTFSLSVRSKLQVLVLRNNNLDSVFGKQKIKNREWLNIWWMCSCVLVVNSMAFTYMYLLKITLHVVLIVNPDFNVWFEIRKWYSVIGLGELVGLRELDLANNCLCDHRDLEPIKALHKLAKVFSLQTNHDRPAKEVIICTFLNQHPRFYTNGSLRYCEFLWCSTNHFLELQLSLEGNPLCYHPEHRIKSLENVHPLTLGRVSIIFVICYDLGFPWINRKNHINCLNRVAEL